MMGKNKKGVNKKNTDRNTVLHGGERREREGREERKTNLTPQLTTPQSTKYFMSYI